MMRKIQPPYRQPYRRVIMQQRRLFPADYQTDVDQNEMMPIEEDKVKKLKKVPCTRDERRYNIKNCIEPFHNKLRPVIYYK